MIYGICTECGDECSAITEEDGIGAYEFWGTSGFDSGLVISSDCCDAEMVTEAGRPVTADDLRD